MDGVFFRGVLVLLPTLLPRPVDAHLATALLGSTNGVEDTISVRILTLDPVIISAVELNGCAVDSAALERVRERDFADLFVFSEVLVLVEGDEGLQAHLLGLIAVGLSIVSVRDDDDGDQREKDWGKKLPHNNLLMVPGLGTDGFICKKERL